MQAGGEISLYTFFFKNHPPIVAEGTTATLKLNSLSTNRKQTMARKAPESINRIGGKQLFDLQVYTQAEYTAAGLSDPDFAKQASEALGFPVSSGNIFGVREAFGIPSSVAIKKEAKKQTIAGRLAAVEAWIRAFDKDSKI